MKKGKIVFLAFMIISYALFVYCFMVDERTLYMASFIAFTVFLLVFVLLAFIDKESKTGESDSELTEDESVTQIDLGETATNGNISNEDLSNENTSNELKEKYISEIKGLKIAMEDQRDSYETQLDELEQKLSVAETETNALKQKIEELTGLGSEEAIRKAFEKKDAAASILPKMTGNGSETIDIVGAARSVADELKYAASTAGMRIQVSSSDDHILVKADAGLIRVLLRNIVDNSIKYMRRQGTLVITLSTIADDLFVVLKDNGEGLSESETEHIFELNYQGSNRISGNGLGLAQAKAVVEYYGGNIYAKSSPGGGMGIYIQLPTT